MLNFQTLTPDWIGSHKENFLKLSKLDESTIQEIWRQLGEEKLDDYSNLEYSWNAPLYQKMIFRFRNAKNRPEQLCKEVDTTNQRLMLGYYGILWHDDYQLVEFFAWIKNWLSIINIYQLDNMHEGLENIDQSELVKTFESCNGIDFFFGLDENKQKVLIDKYNRECIAVLK